MNHFIDYKDILQKFIQNKINFVLIGGFAAIAYGVVRVTMDLDLVLSISQTDLIKAWKTLKKLGFQCRQPITEKDFTNPKKLTSLIVKKNAKAISFYHKNQQYLVVDLLFDKGLNLSDKDIVKLPLFGCICPVISIDKLIELKKNAGRPKDLEDIRELKKIRKK